MKTFAAVYCVVLALSALLVGVPQLLWFLLDKTDGFATPIMLLPTIALYGAVCIPAILLHRIGWSPKLAVVVGGLSVLALSVTPGLLHYFVSSMRAQAFLSKDAFRPPVTKHSEAELRVQNPYGGQPGSHLREMACNELCQASLQHGVPSAIRVVSVGFRGRDVTSVHYNRQKLAACPPAFAEGAAATLETRYRATQGDCLVPAIAKPGRATLRLTYPNNRKISRARTFQIHEWDGKAWKEAARITELRGHIISIPFMVTFKGRGGAFRPTIRRAPFAVNQGEGDKAFAAYLGTSAIPAFAEPSELPVDTVNRILSVKAPTAIGPELMTFINNYLTAMVGRPKLHEEDVQLLRKLINNRRVTDYSQLSKVLQLHPEVAARLVADLLDRLETPVEETGGQNYNHLSWTVARAPIESIERNAGRILAIAESSDDWPTSPLLSVLGKFDDPDPSNLLRQRLEAQSEEVRAQAAVAICNAKTKWGTQLAGDLQKILVIYRGKPYKGNEDLVAALAGLKKWGMALEAESFFSETPDPHRQKLVSQVNLMSCGT